MDVLNGTNTGLNLWTNGLAATTDYQERVAYDPNGNIQTYLRNGYGSTLAMDNLTYNYRAGTNKLTSITDLVAAANYPNDIDNQAANNYTYDSIGNLLTDQQAGITANMTWSVYGKLLTISSKSLSYQYDASGNRIGKSVSGTNSWYVRDAQGNVLSTYNGATMALQEQDLYGSSRLGLISGATPLAGTAQFLDALGSGTIFTFTRGRKLFELSNHLGNVLATVSDKKFGTQVPGIPSQVLYYTADVKSAQDYYPGGMQEPGRSFTSSSTYRYGFNGKEKSDEINGNAVDYDYGARISDSRIARFFSVDPLTKKYPELTPYQFASDQPIWAIDLDGEEAKIKITTEVSGYTVQRLTGMAPRGTLVVVPTFKIILTDAQNQNKVLATGNVTRDSWYSRGSNADGEYELINRHFEPADASKNLYTGERYNYPLGTDLKAYKLNQFSSSTLNAQPHSIKQETFLNGTPIDEARINYSKASNIYLHIGGFYQHSPGPDKTLAASYGCFGFVSSTQIYTTIKEADEAIKSGTWNIKGITNSEYLSFMNQILQVKDKYNGTENDKVLIQVIKRKNVKEETKKLF